VAANVSTDGATGDSSGLGAESSLAFSPDGHLLAIASLDQTAHVWNLEDPRHPREITILRGHEATAGANHTIRLWETDTERLATRICQTAYPRITKSEWDQHLPSSPTAHPGP
jgi:WD40 repeat protein